MRCSFVVAFLALVASVSLVAGQGNCDGCKAIIGAVETQLQQQATVKEIEVFLEQLCKFAPTLNATCVAIFEAGVPQVVQWIELHENASVVCKQLKMCTSRVVPRIQARLGATPDCEACQAGIGFVEHWLSENSTVSWIETEFDNTVCKLIPNIKSTCDAVAAAGIPTVINWIETNENATVVCQQLKVCSSSLMAKAFSLRSPRIVPAMPIRPKNRINVQA